ncbi:dissimilatory sulfite reductase (desulfoviridin), alpha/beta subunit [Sphaerochaeta pleomorpha str. Grapes]|uniref:Dissimilatory sulfite reductase (Desulfoviridin), alpha/beta subunit n=1 Tax=Sphaerochaeta pleomorpha (strain ATCC BAA-1885 / DSM 22778 / Grapes) TaxID=158190 RepID=G8QR51_SPHPG|nr:4Fe-4S binding protein [Sphaerochaeta pleomorpha]AEV30986.1 dissimilatory sulfite reductase (desulfoviridin), alpha/beta subunit [Sphaerochaeta pleomorpha str. Grapes]
MKPTTEEIKELKGQGFLKNRSVDSFSARIITKNGCLTADQLKSACEASNRYGNGMVTMTSRLTIELPGIAFETIPSFKKYIAGQGLETGGTGHKVRPVVSCKGTTCTFGLCDTQSLALEIHQRFYVGYQSVTLPHKFKIACGGCPNNCVKPDLNDFGIVAQKIVSLDSAKCKACKICKAQVACPLTAITKAGKATIERGICNNCGRCIEHCPFSAIVGEETRFSVYLGGRWGKRVRIGTRLTALYSRAEVLDMVEKALLLFIQQGSKGERFASLVDRLGTETIQLVLEGNTLLEQKEAILHDGQ